MVTYESDITKYTTISILGQGYSGAAIVCLSKHDPSGTMVAIKKINMDKAKEEANLIQVCMCAMQILSLLYYFCLSLKI